MTFDGIWVEHWLRDHVIRHIPGGRLQLSEFLGLRVLDAGNHRVGTVVDVRLTISGDLQHNPSTPRVLGLVVSPRTESSFLGCERSMATTPALLSAFLSGVIAARSWRLGGGSTGGEDSLRPNQLHPVFGRYGRRRRLARR